MMWSSRQNALIDWVASPTGPWNAIQGRYSALPQTAPGPEYESASPTFSAYPGSNAHSDCDALIHGQLLSDSGYGSRPGHSVTGDSIHDECDQYREPANVLDGISGLQFDQAISSPQAWGQQAPVHAIDVPVPVNPERNALVCPTCEAEVKTKSELKYALLVLLVSWDLANSSSFLSAVSISKDTRSHIAVASATANTSKAFPRRTI